MGWIRQLFSRRRHYDELSEAIREHLDEKIADLMDRGMSRKQAEQTARCEFGNVTRIEERSREVWQWPTLESIAADIKSALRQLWKSPGFTITAIFTLSLGIAVNATMFSMVSAFLLPALPGHDAQKIVVLSSVDPNRSFIPDRNPVSAPNYLAWRADRRAFAEMAAEEDGRTGNLSGQKRPEAIQYASVTPNYFSVFRVTPELGRTFAAGEDVPGRDHVAILSYGLWKSRYGADPAIVGRSVRLDRQDYTVVGVMAADFRLLGFVPQLWTPLTLSASDETPAARNNRYLYVFARLASGVTVQDARAQMSVMTQRAQQDFPEIEKRWGSAVRTLPDFLVHNFGIANALAVIMTMVSFVLLIACANVTGLLLTRGAARRKELAIRSALGASRVRVMRQLLTEGLVIAIAGGTSGLLLTVLGIHLLRAGLTFNDAISSIPVTLDRHVLEFTACISLVSAVLSSLAPAMKASHAHLETDLRSESRTSSAGPARGKLRSVLVGSEIAMALFLLTGSCLIIRGIYQLEHQKLGFRLDHLLTAGLVLDHARYNDSAQQLKFVHDLMASLQQLPGVENVAVASQLPATGGESVPIRVEGEPIVPTGGQHNALNILVTPHYFSTAAIPLLRGRVLTEADDSRAPRVAVVNQEFARRFFGSQDAIGKRILIQTEGTTPAWAEIVGVASDVKAFSEETRVDPEVYRPFLQQPIPSFSVMLRTNVDANSLISDLRHAVAELDPELPLLSVMNMDGVIETQRNGDPVFTKMLTIFASLALILAAIGIYGLIAYSVSQRTQEIGIRLALGANRSDISWMILKEGLKVAVIGSAIGLVVAVPLPRLFDSMFVGIHFGAPALYPFVLAIVLIVAILATLGPAKRATYIDPLAALRSE
ncbi:MAG TPA: ABC transporter permease [Silvibacterium sp.]|nr:ABC transporter permease [Silvibacterium sp.]